MIELSNRNLHRKNLFNSLELQINVRLGELEWLCPRLTLETPSQDIDDDVGMVTERDLYFPTSTIIWVEETLFLLQENLERRRMFGLDMPFETVIDVGNSSRFAAFTPHDAGTSQFS